MADKSEYNDSNKEVRVFFEKIREKHRFCILYKTKSKQKRLVIFCHGFPGNTTGSSRFPNRVCNLLAKKGISSLRFDQLGCGNSEGEFMESSYLERIKTIKFFIKKYSSLGYKIALFGQSMGASAAVCATKIDKKYKPKCLALWVPDTTTQKIESKPNKIDEVRGMRYKYKFWHEAKKTNFLKKFGENDSPTLVVLAGKDKYMSEYKNKEILSAKKETDKMMVFDNLDHSAWSYRDSEKIIQLTVNFIKFHLK